MMKSRSPSDPPPSTNTEHYGGNNPTLSSTLPARVPRNLRVAEPFPMISAATLLAMDVSHSGWVRKEGYGYRSWKSRFMVLHHGCIYYFKETDSGAPKGKFALNGYRCFAAPDKDKVDRYPYVFKLVPEDEERRTYYISSPSKSEMEGWTQGINNDIQQYCPSEYDYVDTCGLGKSATCPTIPKQVPMVNKRVPGDGGISYSHSFPTSSIMEKFAPLPPPKLGIEVLQTEKNPEDEVYESVDKYFGGDEEHYIAIVRDEADDTSSSPGQHVHVPPNGNNGKPVPPVRPTPPPRPPDMREDSESDSESSGEDEELYLDLIKAQKRKERSHAPGSPRKNGLSPTSPERERPVPPPPVQNGDDLSEANAVTYLSVIGNKEFDDITSKAEADRRKPPSRPSPKPRQKREFDYLPSECFKPEMQKNQAKIFLELGRTIGEYIINASQSSDTKMSLSVWLPRGVKHYLIFKREEMYTLDPSLSENFADLRELVKYYYTHPLPKSGKNLTAPFASKSV